MGEALGISKVEFIFYLINFLILVGILSKFLYKPFLTTMENRKNSIKEALDNAEMINKRADEKMSNYNKRIANVEAEGRDIIKEAKQRADKQANEIIEDAHKQAADIMEKAQREIEREREKTAYEMKQQIAVLALLAAEKIIEHEIETNGQDQIIEKILEEAGAAKWQSLQ